MFRSTNPTLQSNTFRDMPYVADRNLAMSVDGVIFKSIILLALLCTSAAYTWSQFISMGSTAAAGQMLYPWMMGSVFVGFIVAMVTIFKKEWAPITAPIYALVEGVFIGAISAILNAQFPGVPIQAALLTFGTLTAMLVAYQSGLIRATEKFKMGVVAATGGIALVYFLSIILSFFGVQMPFIYGNGLFSIGFSIFVCGIAALNLIMDFDFIEQGTKMGLPKYMEWYSSFSLMVTLIWLYIEFLRLLSKLRSR